MQSRPCELRCYQESLVAEVARLPISLQAPMASSSCRGRNSCEFRYAMETLVAEVARLPISLQAAIATIPYGRRNSCEFRYTNVRPKSHDVPQKLESPLRSHPRAYPNNSIRR